MLAQKLFYYKWLIAALIVLLGNSVVYQLSFTNTLTTEQLNGMVIGSLVDCAIVAPMLKIRNSFVKCLTAVLVQ